MLAKKWRKGNTCVLLVGLRTGTATVENSVELPQKIKNETAYDPAILLWEFIQRKLKQ